MKLLDRQKLDVADQTRSNLFGWRGQFTPESVASCTSCGQFCDSVFFQP